MRRGTNRLKRPCRRPAPKPGVVRAPHQHRGGGGGVPRGSTSAHTRNGHVARTRRATGLSPRNAQTAWNGLPAGKGKGHPSGTTRNTHREGREGREEPQQRRKNLHRPRPPRRAASAEHTRPGHCTREGSSSTQCDAPAPRLGSLRASPWGSDWRQASSPAGLAAPGARATTHQGGGVVGKCLQPRLLTDTLTGEWRNGEAGEGQTRSPVNPGDSATRQEVCHERPPTRSRWGGYHVARPCGPPGAKNVAYPKNQTSNLLSFPPVLISAGFSSVCVPSGAPSALHPLFPPLPARPRTAAAASLAVFALPSL